MPKQYFVLSGNKKSVWIKRSEKYTESVSETWAPCIYSWPGYTDCYKTVDRCCELDSDQEIQKKQCCEFD